MNEERLSSSLIKLEDYCAREQYKGWDPFDGLNSRVFQALPLLKKWDLARLVWLQSFKRNPLNLRKLFLVPKEFNSKGIGLLLKGYCHIYNYRLQTDNHVFGSSEEIILKIRYLANLLLSLQSKGFSGACWGYNFDWQARRLFLFPKNTPTIVATTFCATALFDAFEVTRDREYLDIALSSADFVLKDLKRTHRDGGFLFSYSPFDGNSTVYNASLMGSKLLSYCFHYTNREILKTAAQKSVMACVRAQNNDGSWYYGELPIQKWIDSFHTGYNIDCLTSYQELTGDHIYSGAIEKGFDFYIGNFFLQDGTPKYYHNKIYPIDIHSPAQFFITLGHLNLIPEYKPFAEKVLNWTISNMQNRDGYFYYQIRKKFSSRISYMRWNNAFMFYALSYYLLKARDGKYNHKWIQNL